MIQDWQTAKAYIDQLIVQSIVQISLINFDHAILQKFFFSDQFRFWIH